VSADIGTYSPVVGGGSHACSRKSSSGSSGGAPAPASFASYCNGPPPRVLASNASQGAARPVIVSCTPPSRARLRRASSADAGKAAEPLQTSSDLPDAREAGLASAASFYVSAGRDASMPEESIEAGAFIARDVGQGFSLLSGGCGKAGRTTNVSLRVPDDRSGSVQEIQFVMQNGAVKRQEQRFMPARAERADDSDESTCPRNVAPAVDAAAGWRLESPAPRKGSEPAEVELRHAAGEDTECERAQQSSSLVEQYWGAGARPAQMRACSAASSSSSSSTSSLYEEYSEFSGSDAFSSPRACSPPGALHANRESLGSSVKVSSLPPSLFMLAHARATMPLCPQGGGGALGE
jgi:hypothetical protein